MFELRLNEDSVLDLYNIGNDIFAPLTGFMDSKDYRKVVKEMHLANGQPWTIPVTLEVPAGQLRDIKKKKRIVLTDAKGRPLASMTVEDVFKVDYGKDIKPIFGVDDGKHPGVAREMSRSPVRIGGPIKILAPQQIDFPRYAITPKQTKAIFKKKKWKTISGFQTRNPIHRAHEYLQRVAMEFTDGVFIQPLVGWKKKGDITPAAIVASYELMMNHYYSPDRAVFALLNTPMRYAGPREAVFHAIIRRNFGCTHFIVGRDHAGVGNYYGKYEAQKLCARFNDLGIKILALCGPHYCSKCETIVTEKSCSHNEQFALLISGTDVRGCLKNKETPPKEYMRPEVGELLLALHKRKELFVE